MITAHVQPWCRSCRSDRLLIKFANNCYCTRCLILLLAIAGRRWTEEKNFGHDEYDDFPDAGC